MKEFFGKYKAPIALFIFLGFLIFIIMSLRGLEIDTKGINDFLATKVKDSTLGDIAQIGIGLIIINSWFSK